jgi:hypothetical protein
MRVLVSLSLLAVTVSAGPAVAQPVAASATVMRLKSCFGRGLLLFRAADATVVEKDELLLHDPTPGAR